MADKTSAIKNSIAVFIFLVTAVYSASRVVMVKVNWEGHYLLFASTCVSCLSSLPCLIAWGSLINSVAKWIFMASWEMEHLTSRPNGVKLVAVIWDTLEGKIESQWNTEKKCIFIVTYVYTHTCNGPKIHISVYPYTNMWNCSYNARANKNTHTHTIYISSFVAV